MSEVFEILENLQKSQRIKNKSPEKLSSCLGISKEKAEQISIDLEFIDEIIEEAQKDNLWELCNRYGLKRNFLNPYLLAISVTHPGIVSIKELKINSLTTSLKKIKQAASVKHQLDAGTPEKKIAENLDITSNAVQNISSKMDDILYQESLIHALEKKDEIRNFFKNNPYSTIYEACQEVHLTAQQIRSHIESMVMNGEEIQYRNMPNQLEMEDIRNSVVEAKLEEPHLSNIEISRKFGISPAMVGNVIKQTAKQWSKEKVESYEFYFQSVFADLQEIQRLALERFEASKNSSSKWLEINLTAANQMSEMLGLKAPQKTDITKQVSYDLTSQERDKIVSASIQTEADVLDVDFKKIEVTGENR